MRPVNLCFRRSLKPIQPRLISFGGSHWARKSCAHDLDSRHWRFIPASLGGNSIFFGFNFGARDRARHGAMRPENGRSLAYDHPTVAEAAKLRMKS